MTEPYYQDDHVTIYHGDSLEIMPTLIDVAGIVTDPPYGVGYDYGNHFDDIEGDEYWAWLRRAIDTMRGVDVPTVFTHRLAALKHITDWEWLSVWNKPMAMSGLNAYPVMPHWEPIFMYGIKMRKDLPRKFDVISANPVRPKENGHPCPKPVALVRQLVNWVVPTGVILDPFMGSGTTLVVAKEEGRRAIGIEQSEWYCQQAAHRMGQGVLF